MRRVLLAVIIGLGLVAAVALWQREGSSPDDESQARLRARAAPARTHEPIDERALQARIRDLMASGGQLDPAALDEKIALALDTAAPLRERIRAVQWLARLGNDEALDVLEELLARDEPAGLKAAVAEALGTSPHPQARTLLADLLGGSDDALVRGAIRGLAASGDPRAVATLRAFLLDENASPLVRAEAALALGEIGGADALEVLVTSFEELEGEGVIQSILFGLSEHDFAQTEPFFRNLLASADISLRLKVDALRALATTSPDAADLLLETASSSSEPALRAAAVASLAMLAGYQDGAAGLLALLPGETSPAVRQEIYSALAFAGSEDAGAELNAVLPRVLAEQAPRTRLEGSRLVAKLVRDSGDLDAQDTFDRELSPWLRDQALSAGGRYERLTSIDALKLAGTPASRDALVDLARAPDPQTAAAAEAALEFQERLPPANAN